MMFSIVYSLKRCRCISAFSTEFLLWIVLWAQLQEGNSPLQLCAVFVILTVEYPLLEWA
jgi:hypothetical protein